MIIIVPVLLLFCKRIFIVLITDISVRQWFPRFLPDIHPICHYIRMSFSFSLRLSDQQIYPNQYRTFCSEASKNSLVQLKYYIIMIIIIIFIIMECRSSDLCASWICASIFNVNRRFCPRFKPRLFVAYVRAIHRRKAVCVNSSRS